MEFVICFCVRILFSLLWVYACLFVSKTKKKKKKRSGEVSISMKYMKINIVFTTQFQAKIVYLSKKIVSWRQDSKVEMMCPKWETYSRAFQLGVLNSQQVYLFPQIRLKLFVFLTVSPKAWGPSGILIISSKTL